MAEQNTLEDNIQEVIKKIEQNAADFFEGVAETFLGKAETLRDGTELEPVELPRDLYAHKNAQTEWWYYTGHGETVSGKRFGFELVFFKRRTDLDKFSLIPLRLFGNPIYFAHFALTDCNDKKFRYAHRKSANGWFDLPASASEKHFHLRLGDWSLRESHGTHILRATTASDVVFEANLKPTKKPVLNGKEKNGVSFKDKAKRRAIFPTRGWKWKATSFGMAKPNILQARRGWTGNSARGHQRKIKKVGIGFRFSLTTKLN
ncbi:MAG: carotenoid 1,2-hydratase [Acidobacteriota bacterium]|nr:carotenoid 1,2-hydratase [Acidobacteriota bacterium]